MFYLMSTGIDIGKQSSCQAQVTEGRPVDE
jgi:hypothetical protein